MLGYTGSQRYTEETLMAILHVRNVPAKLYKRIQKLAEEENRSVTAEVIQLLGQGLQAREARRGAAAVIERIRQRAQKIELPRGWKDSAELLREDRSR
jgi:plasmid stability protein